MRLGILTQTLGHNYGGILQNYALQVVLRELGHEPITIDYGKKSSVNRATWWRRKIKHWFRKRILRNNSKPFKAPFPYYGRVQKRQIGEFIERYINKTAPYDKIESSIIDRYNIEGLVVGSDQTWRPRYNLNSLYDMYCEFAANHKMKKISYAASFGASEWEYSPAQEDKCRGLIKSLDAISVREKGAVDMCKEHFGVDAKWVLDPTLLLSSDHYTTLCKRVETDKKPLLYAYILDLSPKILDSLRGVANDMGMELLVKDSGAGMTRKSTVEGWISSFKDAEYVITDSFHGTVFSVLFKKNFLLLRNDGRGGARFDSILDMLDLHSRVTLYNGMSAESLKKDIDWVAIDEKINAMRKVSIEYLKSSLEG